MRFKLSNILKNSRLGTDHLWPLIVLAGFGFYTSLVPQVPNDLWWHLKIGEQIHTTGTVPTTALFTWVLPTNTPFTYGAWLAEYLFYGLYRLGGVNIVLTMRTVLALLAFGLVGYEAWRQGGSWRLASLAVVLAGLMSLNNLIARPQNWAWSLFMGFYILLGKYADGQLRRHWLLLCPLLMAFWVNVHGSFVLAPIMVGIFLMGEALRTWLKWSEALSWRDVKWLAIIEGLTLAATSANPQFARIYGYVVNMMTDLPSQSLIVEWQSPTPEGIANITFFASILILLLVLAYTQYRPKPTEALLIVAFLWLAWSGQRYVVWFAMIGMPFLVKVLSKLVPPRFFMAPSLRNRLNLVLALLLCIPVILAQPWFLNCLPLPETYWKLVLRDSEIGMPLSIATPVQAVAYLEQHPGGHLFNEMGYGSYLIWAMPEQGVFIDPRVELYPYEQWLDYIRISDGVNYNELLMNYNVDRILLDLEKQKTLSELLAGDPLWEMEYHDSYAQIWRRSSEE